MLKIICENAVGEQLDIVSEASPLEVISLDGFSDIDFTVHTTQNSGQDGETYTGAQAQKRNLVISGEIRDDFRTNRDKLYSFFQPRSQGTIYFYEDDNDAGRKAVYRTESIKIGDYGVVRACVISLICPDPKWYAEDQLTQLAAWQGKITFPLQLHPPFVVTTKTSSLIGIVHNDSSVALGLTVRFTATGEVVNPSLYDVNRQQLMQVNTTMHAGDIIIITTAEGNKRVFLTSGGLTTNINNRMAYPPVWLKAYQGDNLFRYNADSGIDSLSVSILSTPAYWGA